MALVVESEGPLTTVLNSPVQLAAPTASAIRILRLDLSALVQGEIGHLRVQTKVRSAGTIRDQYYLSYIGPVSSIIETPPITSDLGLTASLTQVGGTARTVDWQILTSGSAPAVESEGTGVCTPGTPLQLAAPTTNKTRVLRLDLSPLIPVTNAAPESLRIQISTKVRTAGTVRLQHDLTYCGALGVPILETVPISGVYGTTFAITLAGTSRSVDWKVLTLD